MSCRALSIGLALAMIPVVLSSCTRNADRSGEGTPNVVLVIVDDPGYHDFAPGADRICRTPHIDTLAEHGTRFTSAYATAYACSPSRAAILTGRYQNRFGYEFNPGHRATVADDFGLPITETTLGEAMREAGYVTGFIGKWHLGFAAEKQPLERGFDEFFGFLGGGVSYFDREKNPFDPLLRGTEPVEEREYTTHAFTREAVDFIDRHAGGEEPFFLCVSYNAVHFPWEAPDEDVASFPEIPEGPRRVMAAMVKALDDGIGEMLNELREEGVFDDTLFVLLGDNGGATNSDNSPLRGFKGFCFEGGLRVPLVVQWPGRIPGGGVFDGLTSAMDVFPTAVAAGRGSLPEDRLIDGVDLMPHLSGERSGSPHDTLCWRYGWKYAIRQGEWKLIRQVKGRPQSRRMLFHLARDIGEANNLATRSPEIADRLDAELNRWEETLVEPRWSDCSTIEIELRKRLDRPWTRGLGEVDKGLDGGLPVHPTR